MATSTRRRSKTQKRLITAEDLHRFVFVADPQVAPAGDQIVFVHKTIGEKNEYVTNLWIVDASGRDDARAFTSGNTDRQPRFSPHGTTIAFVRDAEKGRPQVWLIPIAGGEAKQLTSFPVGRIGAVQWSPNGRHLGVSFRATEADRTADAQKDREAKGLTDPPWVIDDWWYRLDGDGYFGTARFDLRLVDVATGDDRIIYDKDDLGGLTFDFSPDGKKIAIATNRDRKAMIRPDKCELLKLDVASGKFTSLRGLPEGPIVHPKWSPDGKKIAYAGRDDPRDWEYSTENLDLFVCDATRGGSRSLTESEDYCLLSATLSDIAEVAFAPNFRWSADSKRLFAEIGWHGETHIASVAARGGKLTFHTSGAAANHMHGLSADGRTMSLTTGSATVMPEVAVARTKATGAFEVKRLTTLNTALLAELKVSKPTSKWVRSADGTRVQTWTMMPPRPRRGRTSAVLEIHGGPHAQYGVEFFHEFQVLAAAGHVVVFSNPRGSKGYGRDHCDAIRGHWGGADWVDIQAVTEYMKTLPGVDPARLGVMGGSYGGYMTNWAIGHTKDFAGAITDRCVSNLHSMVGSSDYVNRPDGYFPGNSWDRPEALWEQSPLKYLGAARTPTLIIHSEGDLRCNVEQAEQVFVALKLRNVPTRFVRYPRTTSHGMSRSGPPDMRLHRLDEIRRWWEKWLA